MHENYNRHSLARVAREACGVFGIRARPRRGYDGGRVGATYAEVSEPACPCGRIFAQVPFATYLKSPLS